MTGLLIKIILCPIVIYVSDMIFTGINYPYLYQIGILGIIIAVSGHIMELLVLKRGRFWISNILDFAVALALVYLSRYFFLGASVTLGGALLTAILLFISEYVQHLYLIRSGKTIKSR